MTAPEPLMPLLIARKPGGKPLEVLIDEAAGERLVADLVIALAGIRAAKAAVLAMTAPDPWDADSDERGTGLPYRRCPSTAPVQGSWHQCVSYDGHGGNHGDGTGVEWPVEVTPPGEVVDATIHEEWCDGGHGDAAPCPPDASAGAGELPPPWSDEGNAAFWAAHPRVAAALASVPGAGLDDPAASPPPCPDGPADEHGPCARLAGHPVPHRDIHGSEWFPGGGTRAPEGQCGEAWPVDPALTCFREPGHHGQHAADPGGERQTRTWPNANDDSVLGEPDEPMPVSFLPLNRAALIGGGA